MDLGLRFVAIPHQASEWILKRAVVLENERRAVKINGVGQKEHNKLYLGGKETLL